MCKAREPSGDDREKEVAFVLWLTFSPGRSCRTGSLSGYVTRVAMMGPAKLLWKALNETARIAVGAFDVY